LTTGVSHGGFCNIYAVICYDKSCSVICLEN